MSLISDCASSNTAKTTLEINNYTNVPSAGYYEKIFSFPTNEATKFGISCYANRQCPFYSKKYTIVYLYFDSCAKNEIKVRYRISILNSDGVKCRTQEGIAEISFDERYFAHYQLLHENLLNSKNELLVNNKLTIYCEVEEMPIESALISNGNFVKLSENYETLLESGKLSDVCLIVGDKELKVHKLVLSTRSPVFAAMFAHDSTKEAQENRVEIIDVDVEVLEVLIKYIYTGKVETLDPLAADLLVAADKYQMNCLKSICEHYLCAAITTETVSQLYLLADLHHATELNHKCIEYIGEHGAEVMVSVGWKKIAIKPDLLVKLFHNVTLKLSEIKNQK